MQYNFVIFSNYDQWTYMKEHLKLTYSIYQMRFKLSKSSSKDNDLDINLLSKY